MKKIKCFAAVGILAAGMLATTACTKTQENNTVYYEHELLSDEEMVHEDILERSLVSVGNTERVQKAIYKAMTGEDVNMVYLGGSITEGLGASKEQNCYAYLSYYDFKNTYGADGGKNVHYYNVGISGTPSTLGLARSTKDVLDKDPDIVFIEFAVNDGTDAVAKMMYESLVKRILESDTQPAVILIFTVLENGYSAQEHMQAIGENYDLGMISVKDAITPLLESGEMTFQGDYAADEAHPNNTGHNLIMQFISHYFEHAYNTVPEAYEYPETYVYGTPYENPITLNLLSDAVTDAGSFTTEQIACYTYEEAMVHSEDAGNDPLTVTATFSKLILSYEQFNNAAYGDLEVWIDGTKAATLSGNSSSAWNNPAVEVVLNETEAAEHTVELKMADGSEELGFVLLDITICE